MKEPKPPQILFKYESFNTYSLSNLKNAQIYFNRPIDFNDPFDCSVMKESISYTKADIVKLYNKFNKEHKIKSTSVINYSDVPLGFVEGIELSIIKVSNEVQDKNLKEIGCSCFSEVNNDILMWSHYADGHRGFCLEFDTSAKPFNKAMKVFYKKDYPKWNPLALILSNEDELVEEALKPLRYKYDTWKYEKEWRIFHKEQKKLFTYEVNSLRAVYFGMSIDLAHVEIICLILLGQNPNIKFYKTLRSDKKYKVYFEEFTYTPYKKTI